jgi:hypothetical protein
MTSEKLFSILSFLDSLDTNTGLQTTLASIGDALVNLASSPANTQFQTSLATGLATLDSATAKLRASITPTQLSAIREIGGEEFFDPVISTLVTRSVQLNAMTPSVSRDYVQTLVNRRAAFLNTVRTARQSLEQLGISESKLEAGSADISFLIPRNIFENRLGNFARELSFINRLMEHFSEAMNGEAATVELEQLSSSIPTVGMVVGVGVIGAVLATVNKFLEAWEKIEKIRKIRAELTEMGMKVAAVDELTEQITTTVEKVVEESTELVLANYPGHVNRKNELSNAIRQDTRRLFAQIERGLTVEARVEPNADADLVNQDALGQIVQMSREMRFPQITNEPLLLENGEILEGDIQAVKYSKKTTTQKTTTSKKEAVRDGKAETKD